MGCIPGDTLCWEEELPRRKVAIKNGFWMTTTEVTVGAFREFLKKCAYTPESEVKGEGRIYQNEQDDWIWTAGVNWQYPLMPGVSVPDEFPVAQVSWQDAHQYCTCMGGACLRKRNGNMQPVEAGMVNCFPGAIMIYPC